MFNQKFLWEKIKNSCQQIKRLKTCVLYFKMISKLKKKENLITRKQTKNSELSGCWAQKVCVTCTLTCTKVKNK